MRPVYPDSHRPLLIVTTLLLLVTLPDQALATQKKHQARSQTHRVIRPAGKTLSKHHDQKRHRPAPQHVTHPPPRTELDDDNRISELRNWLNQRNAERDHRLEPNQYDNDLLLSEPNPPKTESLKRRPLDLSYTPPDEETPTDRDSVLRIGRGPDGRIYHRYVLRDTEADTMPAAMPPDAVSSPILERRKGFGANNPSQRNRESRKNTVARKKQQRSHAQIANKSTRKTNPGKKSRHR